MFSLQKVCIVFLVITCLEYFTVNAGRVEKTSTKTEKATGSKAGASETLHGVARHAMSVTEQHSEPDKKDNGAKAGDKSEDNKDNKDNKDKNTEQTSGEKKSEEKKDDKTDGKKEAGKNAAHQGFVHGFVATTMVAAIVTNL